MIPRTAAFKYSITYGQLMWMDVSEPLFRFCRLQMMLQSCHVCIISFHINATHAFSQNVNFFFTPLLNASQPHQHYGNIMFLRQLIVVDKLYNIHYINNTVEIDTLRQIIATHSSMSPYHKNTFFEIVLNTGHYTSAS